MYIVQGGKSQQLQRTWAEETITYNFEEKKRQKLRHSVSIKKKQSQKICVNIAHYYITVLVKRCSMLWRSPTLD